MREIKFRAWDTEMNYMYSGVDILDIMLDKSYTDSARRLILEQFTGLRDKNGVEIYEGDIVYGTIKGLLGQGYQNGIVKYGEYGFIIDLKKQSWEPGIGMVGFCSFEDYEVIGNIHERSEDNDK